MGILGLSEYNVAEEKAVRELPNRIVEAFIPSHFLTVGYPTRITADEEIKKYADVMHELRFERNLNMLSSHLTEDEFTQLKKINEKVFDYFKKHAGKTVIARSSLLRAMNVYRHIKYIFGSKMPSVLEVGPGSGYLGALCILNNFPYLSYDITQAFYLYQSLLWYLISDRDILECVSDETYIIKYSRDHRDFIIHLPWWKFATLSSDSLPLFDVITCNHALCEMNLDCINFVLKLAEPSFSNGNGILLFEGWGCEMLHSRSEITELLYNKGLKIAFNDDNITVFCISSKNNHPLLDLPVSSNLTILTLRNAFRRALGMQPKQRFYHYPKEFKRSDNEFSKKINTGRTEIEQRAEINREMIVTFFSNLIGQDDFLTDDEKFFSFIGKSP